MLSDSRAAISLLTPRETCDIIIVDAACDIADGTASDKEVAPGFAAASFLYPGDISDLHFPAYSLLTPWEVSATLSIEGDDSVACITESGRIFDTSSFPIRELIDGVWTSDGPNIALGEIMMGRVLSPEELARYEKSGSPKDRHNSSHKPLER